MAKPTQFLLYVCEHLAPLGQVRYRAMFGGWGIYLDDQFCAIVHRDALYFKADDVTRAAFEAGGSHPFKPFADKPMALSYYEAPAAVFEDGAEMLAWGHRALDAALRGRGKKSFKPRKG